MKKKILYIGLILLLIVYFVLDNRINKEYSDYKIIKIKDNELLILKRNNVLSILEIQNQTTNPEKADYKWYQTDNELTILNNNSYLISGKGNTGDGVEKGKLTPIEFDNYKFYWSVHSDGEGFIYLNHYPKYNEKQGAFYWALLPKTSITELMIVDAESNFQLVDIKKVTIIDWILRK